MLIELKIMADKARDIFGNISALMIKTIFVAVFVIVFVSCNSYVVYDGDENIEKSAWKMNDKKVFSVKMDADDIKWQYKFAVNLRNTTEYKYDNIFFFITTIYPDGSITKKDTVECMLALPDGTWKGKGGTNIKDNRFWFAHNVKFPMKGEYVFKIEQATKDSVLTGIKDVGLHIEKMKIE